MSEFDSLKFPTSVSAIRQYEKRWNLNSGTILDHFFHVAKSDLKIPESKLKKMSSIDISRRAIYEIFENLNARSTNRNLPSRFPKDPEVFLRDFINVIESETSHPRGDYKKGEWEVVSLGEDLVRRASKEWEAVSIGNDIIPNAAPEIKTRVCVAIDHVRTRRRPMHGNDDNDIRHFIRIAPSSKFDVHAPNGEGHGGVNLPVDLQRGVVILVCQYRYPRAKWMLEAPRGFAQTPAELAKDTALREASEELGTIPLDVFVDGNYIKLRRLGRFATDSGKLCEAPVHLMSFIDSTLPFNSIPEHEAQLRYGVKVSFRAFFKSLFFDSVEVFPGDVVQLPSNYSFDNHHLDNGRLCIDDAFTALAGMRAWAFLIQSFHNNHIKPSWWDDIQVHNVLNPNQR